MRDCPKSPTRRHEAHVTIPVICQHCRDLLPRTFPQHVYLPPAIGWNTTAIDPDAHLGVVGSE